MFSLGPGAYDTEGKNIASKKSKTRLKPGSSDRYAVLQKKVEDLETLYQDGKKSVNSREPTLQRYRTLNVPSASCGSRETENGTQSIPDV